MSLDDNKVWILCVVFLEIKKNSHLSINIFYEISYLGNSLLLGLRYYLYIYIYSIKTLFYKNNFKGHMSTSEKALGKKAIIFTVMII